MQASMPHVQAFHGRLLGVVGGSSGLAVDEEDNILGGVAGLDLRELGTRVGTCGPVDGGVAAVGDGDVLAFEGGAVDGGKIVPGSYISMLNFCTRWEGGEHDGNLPDLVPIEVVREDLLRGSLEDAVVLGGDLDGDAARLLVRVQLLAPRLAGLNSGLLADF